MAQAGYTPILIYASGTATNIPTAGNLISGSSGAELAINYADGKLYYKDGSGNVKLLSIGYGSSSVTPTNGGVQYGTGTALALTAAGSSGQILRSNGAAAPTWADLSTLGVNTISFGTTGLTPNSATAGAVTVAGTLVTANGGTGLGGATPFTANGVLYASSASALTSGSALTFDGTTLAINGGTNGTRFSVKGTGAFGGFDTGAATDGRIEYAYNGTNIFYTGIDSASLMSLVARSGVSLAFGANGSEQMRLTSTGLGIGTSSPAYKVDTTVNTNGINGYNAYGANGGASEQIGYRAINANSTGIFAGVNGFNYSGGFGSANQAVLTSIGNVALQLGTNSTVRATIDSSGNLGLGVTPSAWVAGAKAIQFGAFGSISGSSGNFAGIATNRYNDGGNKYIGTGPAALYEQGNGVHYWNIAPSGTAGNTITFTQALTLDASGNLLLGGTSAGASSAASLAIFNGTAPTGSVTNGIILYAEDVSSSSELKVRDEAGNVTTLSPHNFSLIPDGPSEDMAWAYYSEKGGKRINVDMLKLARMVEKLTGEKLVYES